MMRLTLKFLLTFCFSTLAVVAVHFHSRNIVIDSPVDSIEPSIYSVINTELIQNSLTDSVQYKNINREIRRFIQRWELTGASVAIAYQNRLIYARGFGWANKEDSIEMQPYNVLRVASTSKLITAVAIMKLVEQNKLQLTDTIFGENGILNDSIFADIKDKRAKSITVHNLLSHSAGWNVRYGDHMFIEKTISEDLGKDLPISLDDIVHFAITRRRLHFKPGSGSRYGNLGYAILQLVIEKVTGEPYESFVVSEIFDPLKINDAAIAESWDSLKLKNEVRYYEVPQADSVVAYDGSRMALKSRGGNDIRTLGAAGGWAISTVSLVKFMLAVDGNPSFPDIISADSYNAMITNENGFYPYGWIMVTKNGEHWRSGSLPGTTVLAKTSADGFTFAFVANSSPWKGSRFPYIINGMMKKVLPKFDSLMLTRNLFLVKPDTLQVLTDSAELVEPPNLRN